MERGRHREEGRVKKYEKRITRITREHSEVRTNMREQGEERSE